MLEDNRNWLTTKEASQISGYTPAHIIRLAQKGNILSKKKDRLWYVDYISLKQSLAEAERTARVRSSELRLRRLEELGKAVYQPISDTKMLNLTAFLATGALFMLGILSGLVFNQILDMEMMPADLMAGAGYIMNEINEAVPIAETVNILQAVEQ